MVSRRTIEVEVGVRRKCEQNYWYDTPLYCLPSNSHKFHFKRITFMLKDNCLQSNAEEEKTMRHSLCHTVMKGFISTAPIQFDKTGHWAVLEMRCSLFRIHDIGQLWFEINL